MFYTTLHYSSIENNTCDPDVRINFKLKKIALEFFRFAQKF